MDYYLRMLLDSTLLAGELFFALAADEGIFIVEIFEVKMLLSELPSAVIP